MVRAKLVPGRIFHHLVAFGSPTRTVKPKFVVFLGILAGRYQTLVINSKPAPFIQRHGHLLDDQVVIDKSDHDFLDHDSTIACHQILELDPREVENALVQNTDNLKCLLSASCREEVIKTAQASVNLMPLEKDFIVQALTP